MPGDEPVGGRALEQLAQLAPRALGGDREPAVLDEAARVDEVGDVLARRAATGARGGARPPRAGPRRGSARGARGPRRGRGGSRLHLRGPAPAKPRIRRDHSCEPTTVSQTSESGSDRGRRLDPAHGALEPEHAAVATAQVCEKRVAPQLGDVAPGRGRPRPEPRPRREGRRGARRSARPRTGPGRAPGRGRGACPTSSCSRRRARSPRARPLAARTAPSPSARLRRARRPCRNEAAGSAGRRSRGAASEPRGEVGHRAREDEAHEVGARRVGGDELRDQRPALGQGPPALGVGEDAEALSGTPSWNRIPFRS